MKTARDRLGCLTLLSIPALAVVLWQTTDAWEWLVTVPVLSLATGMIYFQVIKDEHPSGWQDMPRWVRVIVPITFAAFSIMLVVSTWTGQGGLAIASVILLGSVGRWFY
jgi:hypothetical protein